MMRVKKIAPVSSAPIEDTINEFFMRENISKTDIVYIKPIDANTCGGIGLSDLAMVYVFYDKHDAEQ